MRKIVLDCKNIIMLFFVLTPFVEMFNSTTLINMGGESMIGKTYRIAYIGVLVYSLLIYKINIKQLMMLFIYLCVTVIPVMLCALINGDNFVGKLYGIVKYMLPMITLIVLQQLHSRKEIKLEFVDTIFNIYSWILPVSYFVPLLMGLGYYQYEYGRGYKGLNYMINDVNIVVAMITIYSLRIFLKKRTPISIIRLFLNVSCLLYMQTKTSITVAIIIVIFVLIHLLKGKLAIPKFMVGVVTIVLVMSKLYHTYEEQILLYFERFLYSYVSMKEQGHSFLEFYTTTRSSRLDDFFVSYEMNNRNWLINLLFGLPTRATIYSEMDFFDVLFLYGIFACIYMIFFYGNYVILAIKNYLQQRSIDNLSNLVMISVILSFAALGGHVLQSAYSGCVLSLVCYRIYCQFEERG